MRHGEFRMNQPFMTLANAIASPHNSASVGGWREIALARAVANCRRALGGETPHHLIGDDERIACSINRWPAAGGPRRQATARDNDA